MGTGPLFMVGSYSTLFVIYFECARKICSNECLEEEIVLINNFLRENAYLEKFIHTYTNTNPRVKYDIVGKKTCLLYLRFKRDEIIGIVNHRIDSVSNVT